MNGRWGTVSLSIFLLVLLVPLIGRSFDGVSAITNDSQTSVSEAVESSGFLYDDFASVEGLNLVGDAFQFENILRLTPPVEWKGGAVWHVDKQNVQSGFETTFDFKITDLGSRPPHEIGADGIVFVVQNQSANALGTEGQDIGYANISNSLAIEFDTWFNSGLGDPNNNHISIQTRGLLANVPDIYASLGWTADIPDLSDGNVHSARIRYQANHLEIFLDDFSVPRLSIEIVLEDVLDLDNGTAWIGFTSGTGAAWENHDLLKWSFQNNTYTKEPLIVYYALGDSIASGHGLLGDGDDGTDCHRSPKSYPHKVMEELEKRYEEVEFHHLACSGAVAARPNRSELRKDRYKWIRNQFIDTLDGIESYPTDVPVLVSVSIGLNDYEWTDPFNLLEQMAKHDPKFYGWVDNRTSAVAQELRLQLEPLLAKTNVAIVISEAYNPFNQESKVFLGIGRKGCLDAIGNIWSCYDRAEVALDSLNEAYILGVWVPLGRPDRLRITTGVKIAFEGHESPRYSCGSAAPDVGDTWIQYFGDPNSVSEIPDKRLRRLWGDVNAKGDCFHPNELGAARIAEGVNEKALEMGW